MKLLNAEQVADRLGCSVRHAYTVMKEMRPINIGHGKQRSTTRVKSDALDRWIESRATREPAEAPVKRKATRVDGACTG